MQYENRPVGWQRRLSTTALLNSEWLSVREDHVVDQAGSLSRYVVLSRPSFVLVVPYQRCDGGDRVLLVRRFRYPAGRWFWEFPQSRVGEEDPGALIGMGAQILWGALGRAAIGAAFSIIGSFFEAYGYSDHRCYCIVAELAAAPDEPQPERLPPTRWEPWAAVTRAPLELGIADSATIASFTLVNAWLGSAHDAGPRPDHTSR